MDRRADHNLPDRSLSEAEVYLCALGIALWKAQPDPVVLPPYLLLDHLLRTGGFRGSTPRIIRDIADLLDDAKRDLKRLGVAEDMVVDRRRIHVGIDWGYAYYGGMRLEKDRPYQNEIWGLSCDTIIVDDLDAIRDFTKHENKDPKKDG